MRIAALTLLLAFVGGCTVPTSLSRPGRLSLPAEEGRWRAPASGAVLELTGWEVRVLEAQVADSARAPLLERLVLEVVNTSETEPLFIEPDEISVRDFAGRAVSLGPKDPVVLRRRDRLELRYTPGLRAEILPYPFAVSVTVFRQPRFRGSETIDFRLH
jgi:hypothetical protein